MGVIPWRKLWGPSKLEELVGQLKQGKDPKGSSAHGREAAKGYTSECFSWCSATISNS